MTNVETEEEAAMIDIDNSAPEAAEQQTWLRKSGDPNNKLAALSNGNPDWIFPEGDELFRGIYTRAGTGFASEVIAVCSALAGEGKTTVGLGMAVSMAQDFPDRRVLLVEADVQRPVLSDDFAMEPGPGLLDCLVKGAPLQTACRPTFLENLNVVPAGSLADTPVAGRPLRSSTMAALVEAMRRSYDVVIMDLPALMVNSDSALLTDLADGVVCVVRAGSTPIAMLNRALEQIEQGKLRGLVINGSASAVPGWIRRLAGI
jgi:capsular exopolysaccharide synthesis family protein